MKTLSLISAWLSVVILFGMMWMISGKFTIAKGQLFDLPSYGDEEGVVADVVAIVFPSARETLVFFDDARYSLSDEESLGKFQTHLSEVINKSANSSLLVLSDKRVSVGELMGLTSAAKKSGVARLLLAERKLEKTGE